MSVFYKRKYQAAVCVALLMSWASTAVYAAGGVALGATRVIYPAASKQVSLAVTNTDPENAFLLQSWVEGADGSVTQDFMVTPPLFVIKTTSENTLRLIYAGPPLAEDRETLFWINSKAIPSTSKATEGEPQNKLQLAVVSRIKLFYRPAALTTGPDESAANVSAKHVGDQLLINNPTPYFISLTNVKLGTHELKNTMLAPFSDAQLGAPKGAVGEISYSFINDYGGVRKIK